LVVKVIVFVLLNAAKGFCCSCSGSMEPAFYRGDLLFLTNYKEEPVRVGEIVVFKVEGRDIPIVHRVLKLHEK
jgi:signal peptidase